MARSFEEIRQEVEKKLAEIHTWFYETYPTALIESDVAYDVAAVCLRWSVIVQKDASCQMKKILVGIYTDKMRNTPLYQEIDILKILVPHYKRAIEEGMKAPWEERI